jgi:hypothetical protein
VAKRRQEKPARVAPAVAGGYSRPSHPERSVTLLIATLALAWLAAGLEAAAAADVADFALFEVEPAGGLAKIGDVDNDGHADIIIVQSEHLVWLAYPDFTRHVIREGDFSGSDRFAVVDMDNDGDPDIVTTRRDKPAYFSKLLPRRLSQALWPEPYRIYWYENPSPAGDPAIGANWVEHPIGDQGAYVKDIVAGDINRDGRMDVVARSSERTVIYFAKQCGWTTKTVTHPPHEGLALGDLDGDGDLDLVLNGFWLETPSDPETGPYRQHAIEEKWYTQHTGSWQDNNAYVAVADLNRDGLPDVVLSHSEKPGYPIAWYSVDHASQASTGPWTEHRIADVFDWCQTLAIGDVDGDGAPDVLAAKFERNPAERPPNQPPFPVAIFYNLDGFGTTWREQVISNKGIYAGALGDFGSDGDLDIVGPRSYWTGPVYLWENLRQGPRLSRPSAP